MHPEADPQLATAVEAALAALDDGDFDRAEEALEEVQKTAGENHPRALHLAGLLALSRGETERGLGYLMQATDLGPSEPEIYLDCAEAILLAGEDLAEAEVVVRQALELPTIAPKERAEAQLTLAQVRLERDDLAEATALLDDLQEILPDHPAYLVTRSAVLLAGGKGDEAVAAVERAVAQEPEDPDLHYQLGLTLRQLGQTDAAQAPMIRVLELDARERAEDDGPLGDGVAAELLRRMDEVLSDLPEPLLKLVGHAPVRVERRASAQMVAAGADPRAAVVFEGVRAAPDGATQAQLEGVVIMHDVLLGEARDDDDVAAGLLYGVVEELREFFGRDDILFGEADEA